MARPKRNLFAVLGWIVWKLLSFLGLRFAKNKLEQNENGRRRGRSRSRSRR